MTATLVLNPAKPNEECTCARCVSACSSKPGWFLPGEVLEAAKLLGMEPQAFFDKYLMVDYWTGDVDNIYVLSPAIIQGEPGGMYPPNPHGTCVFLKDDRCSIHAAKPYECRALDHSGDNQAPLRHELVADVWAAHQDEVKGFYADPEPEGPFTIMDALFSGFFGFFGRAA